VPIRSLMVTIALVAAPSAHATTTERALLAACGPAAVRLAPHVDRAARRHLTHPVLLVAVMRVEEHRCRMDRVSSRGARCVMQVLGVARNGHTNVELADPATCIETGTRWLDLMTTWCAGKRAGLGAYGSGHCDRGRRYARKVLRTEHRIWRALARSLPRMVAKAPGVAVAGRTGVGHACVSRRRQRGHVTLERRPR